MLHAFANGEYIGVAGAHVIVDPQAALDDESRLLGELGVGTDADRHHDKRGFDLPAVGEPHPRDMAIAKDGFRIGLRQNLNAALFDRLFSR